MSVDPNFRPWKNVGETWTEDRVARCKALWAEGLSASRIAKELGGITRNSVIGKVHRLGLSGRGKSPSSPRPRWKQVGKRVKLVLEPRQPAAPSKPQPQPIPEIVDGVIPKGQRRTLFELTNDTCRWPIGTPGMPDFYFCGGQSVDGCPYCSYHLRVAYQPPAARHYRPHPRPQT